jgi:hypothetical protein
MSSRSRCRISTGASLGICSCFGIGAASRLKILLWDQSGFWVLYKRLERGTFAWPPNEPDSGSSCS